MTVTNTVQCTREQRPSCFRDARHLATLILLPTAIVIAAWDLTPWLFMWITAFALGAAGKWLTWRDALTHGARPSRIRTLGWFLAWPGLDGRSFLGDRKRVDRPGPLDWMMTCGNLLTGCCLVLWMYPFLRDVHPVAAVWTGTIGFSFVFHFGVIRLMAMCWRTAGVNAEPIMRAPVCATSIAEFWGTRWNLAFSIPSRRFILRPLTGTLGSVGAMFIVFLVSGLLHELVISLPAKANYGLPTLYFAIQAFGVWFERTHAARAFHLKRPLAGWVYMMVFTTAPLPLLFHEPFLNRVMIPFLDIIHTLAPRTLP